MEQIRDRVDYWIKWIIVTSASWLVGIFIARSIHQFINLENVAAALPIWRGIIAGSLLAVGQWVISEKRINDLRIWWLATVLGTVSGLTVTFRILTLPNLGWAWIAAGALGGFILGLSQSLAIKTDRHEDLIWILMTCLSWMFAFIVGFALIREISWENVVPVDAILMTWITGWGIMSMLSIIALFGLSEIDNQRDRSVPMQWC